jgi:hypothetical protein
MGHCCARVDFYGRLATDDRRVVRPGARASSSAVCLVRSCRPRNSCRHFTRFRITVRGGYSRMGAETIRSKVERAEATG